jgi:NitT/TauT family transport system substrate-binding protein
MRLLPIRVALILSILFATRFASAQDTVRVGTPEATAFAFAILDVGIAAGTFAKHGIAVERIDFGGGGKVHQAIAAGSLDMAVGGTTDIALAAKGAPEKAVAAAAGAPVDMALVVRSADGPAQIADLKGKSIGVTTAGSLTSWLALDLALHEGWGPDGVKRVTIGDMKSLVAALVSKNVDAIVGPLEGGYRLEGEGRAKVLVRFADIIPEFVVHAIFASNKMMQEHPDRVRGFLAGWFDTVAFMRANKEEAVRLSMPATHLPPELAGKIYDLEMPGFSLDGHFDPKAFAVVKKSFVDLGMLETMPEDKQLYTEEFLPK